jgi:RND superfamily putative drug exporter
VAWYLYGLGRWCFRHRFWVIGIWVGLLVLGAVGATTLAGKTSDNFNLGNTESSRAFTLIKDRTDAAADGATARIVIQAPPGQTLTDPSAEKAVTQALARVQTDHVLSLVDPYSAGTVSADGRTAYAVVRYDRIGADLSSADKDALLQATTTLRDDGYTAVIGGDALAETAGPGSSEAIGIVIALMVLAITFGSLVAAGMPLLTAVIGVVIGVTGITTLSGFLTLSSTTPALASMLGLAVGIDYALFVMSRFKHEVTTGKDHEEAAGIATGTAGSAVIFAGLTVIIALAGLSLVGISFLTQMGLAAAGTVAVAVLIALTLLPALLSLAGRRVASGRIPGLKDRDTEGSDEVRTNGRRWVELVARFRVPALVLGVLTAVVLSIPVTHMQLALPDDGTQPAASQIRQAYDLISENFGAGTNGPLVVVVDTKGVQDPSAAVDAAVQTVKGVSTDVAAVVPPVTDPTDQQAVAAYQAQLDRYGFATITVIPQSGPSTQETKDLVSTLRTDLKTLHAQTGATPYVTGQTAVGVDVSQSLTDAFPKYLVVVVGLAFLLLLLVFRSILVPLKATLGFLLSIGISLGATVAVFQWGWLQGLIGLDVTSPVVFILPLLLTGILFGLAMDYEVFLVSRMREEYVHGSSAHDAVTQGFTHSARVVTAAAIIMTGVFAGFITGDQFIIKTLGFALAVGVLADAFLVRMTIVPAVMLLVGERMWWLPRWLDKLLPNLDIEGEALARRLAPSDADPAAPVPDPTLI